MSLPTFGKVDTFYTLSCSGQRMSKRLMIESCKRVPRYKIILGVKREILLCQEHFNNIKLDDMSKTGRIKKINFSYIQKFQKKEVIR